MKDALGRRACAAMAAVGLVCAAAPARAVDVEDVGGETLTIDISNTSELGYHFDNRNSAPVDPAAPSLQATQHVDDDYGEWINRLYVRSYYWKLSFGLRLDSAVYLDTMDRKEAQQLVTDELGAPDLASENEFARELHSRYANLIYPAKLWLGFKHKWIEATAGDFYEQLGRGLVFSVRKIDEVGIDTTVRGAKLKLHHSWGGFHLGGTVFGGQLNPVRVDYPTGRILYGGGSPLFFAFPRTSDFNYYSSSGPNQFVLQTERAKPTYLEDNVAGANLTLGPKQVQLELNGALLMRQSNSEDKARCLAAAVGAAAIDGCEADFPNFDEPDASRAHEQIRNFSGAIRVPQIAEVIDGYLEVAGQQHARGRVSTLAPDGSAERQADRWGYAVYANINIHGGPLTASLEGKHYRSFFPLAANINISDPTFGAREYNVVTYSQPPTIEPIYVETVGARDVCVSGGRARLDAKIADHLDIYGWVGRSTSFSEIDPTNEGCDTAGDKRTDTWDTAAGTEIDSKSGSTHYWAWVGARLSDSPEPVPSLAGSSSVFYREGYVRYDFSQHLSGPFSLGLLGNHRRRYEPQALDVPWHEGEDLLAFNYNPHLTLLFGHEYQTRPGVAPTHYFNGAIVYRSNSDEHWYEQLTDQVRLFVGEQRSAWRCAGGVCRIYPAFEGAKIELVSRF